MGCEALMIPPAVADESLLFEFLALPVAPLTSGEGCQETERKIEILRASEKEIGHQYSISISGAAGNR
ncbi:hypothetical protein J6590_030720 [Homalodisca vitripennis]|nr:hypothetical protein J6590_030720 [Homalodisca vitripennis]